MARRRKRRSFGAAEKKGVSPIIMFGIPIAGFLAFFGRKEIAQTGKIVVTEAKALIFKASLPSAARQFSDAILAVAKDTGMDPFTIVALGDRETLWGAASAYKQETGDWAPRCRSQDQINKNPALYKIVGDCSGGQKKVMPADGLGWGRGLMQIDWESHYPWISSNNWRDPYTNIKKGALILKDMIAFLSSKSSVGGITDGTNVTIPSWYPDFVKKQSGAVITAGIYKDPRPLTGTNLTIAAVAAYNTGAGNVLRNIAAGAPAEASTTGANYARDTVQRAAEALAKFVNAGGGTATV